MLPSVLRVELIVFAVIFVIYVINKVNKKKLLLQYSLIWMFIALLIIILAIFPQSVVFIAMLCGIETSSNLVYLIAIVGLLFILVNTTAKLSKQSVDIKKIIQTNAIRVYLEDLYEKEHK